MPSYLQFLQSLGAGQINLATSDAQQQLSFILLKTAINMMNQKYKNAYQFLCQQNKTGSFTDAK